MTPETLRILLRQHPRLPYGPSPTPLRRLAGLHDALGSEAPALWMKRDDELGPGLGGNKGRPLAYLLAQALQQGRRKVATYGGLQSNHARMTAAACAPLDLQAHLFFFQKRPAQLTGNLLLNDLLGARMHFIPFGESDKATMTLERTIRLVRLVSLCFTGPRTYFIPGGGHNLTGCLGYVEAAVELQEQLAGQGMPLEKVTIVTAVGTGGTLAGLMAGLALMDSPMRVLGIDIGRLWKRFPASISKLANDVTRHFGGAPVFTPQNVPLIGDRYVGPGYARPYPPAAEAARLLAQNEGILLDPVYSGKAFAGLLDMVRGGRFAADESVVFLHTGGLPALWR